MPLTVYRFWGRFLSDFGLLTINFFRLPHKSKNRIVFSPMSQIAQTNNNIEQVPMYSTIPNLPFTNPEPQLLFLQRTVNAMHLIQSAFADPTLSLQSSLQRQPRRRRLINEREKCLLLIKMILLYLERSCNIELLDKAKQVIQRCIDYNRQGEDRFMPLKKAIETRLEALLGTEFFTHMQCCLEANCGSTPSGYTFITRRNNTPVPFS